jgi:chlorite dismutase
MTKEQEWIRILNNHGHAFISTHEAIEELKELEQRAETASAVDTIVSSAEWISVYEQLPSKLNCFGKPVIIYRPRASIKVCGAYYNMEDGQFSWETDEGIEFKGVTHWMHVPRPPKS